MEYCFKCSLRLKKIKYIFQLFFNINAAMFFCLFFYPFLSFSVSLEETPLPVWRMRSQPLSNHSYPQQVRKSDGGERTNYNPSASSQPNILKIKNHRQYKNLKPSHVSTQSIRLLHRVAGTFSHDPPLPPVEDCRRSETGANQRQDYDPPL